MLRAVTTPTAHARGFEGLILLGPTGRQTNAKAAADVLRAHEVAHQWWGGYVRQKHWPRDRWLLESLAEYTTMEYYGSRSGGAERALEAMRTQWFEPLTFGGMTRRNLAGAREDLAGGSAYPLLAASDNVYVEKGSDGAFFEMLRAFIQAHRDAPATTEDFARVAGEHLGESLDWFFKQWVADGGLPVLVWHREIERSAAGWRVSVQARQERRTYRLIVPVYLHFRGGRVESRPWAIATETAETNFETSEEPEEVTLDDGLEALVILKRMKAR